MPQALFLCKVKVERLAGVIVCEIYALGVLRKGEKIIIDMYSGFIFFCLE